MSNKMMHFKAEGHAIRKAIIVDNAFLIRKITSKMLHEMGVDVIDEAANQFELINKIKVIKPDVIIMDSYIYKEAKNLVKSIMRTTNIVLTVSSKSDLISAYNDDIRDFVCKPILKENLQMVFENISLTQFYSA